MADAARCHLHQHVVVVNVGRLELLDHEVLVGALQYRCLHVVPLPLLRMAGFYSNTAGDGRATTKVANRSGILAPLVALQE